MTDDNSIVWHTLWQSRWDEDCFRLRFELGGENYSIADQAVPRALQAFTRASTITDVVLGEVCTGIVATLSRADIKSKDDKGFIAEDRFQICKTWALQHLSKLPGLPSFTRKATLPQKTTVIGG